MIIKRKIAETLRNAELHFPHVGTSVLFDERDGTSAATPRRGSPLCGRRGFLTGMLASGALVAAADLPAPATEPACLPFPCKTPRSYLSLGYQRIHIGLPQPFSVLHISDTHLALTAEADPPDKAAFATKRNEGFGGNQARALAHSLAWAKDNADYVIHTGDLIDFQTVGNLDFVRKCFGAERGRLAASMGNHEYQRRQDGEKPKPTPEYNALSEKTLADAFPFDINLQSTVVHGVNFVTLSQVYGLISEEQVERFRAERAKDLPIILCMHVPFTTEHIRRAMSKFWGRSKKFRQSDAPKPHGDALRQESDPVTRAFVADLRKDPLLKGILAGHLHFDVQDRFSPTAMEYVVGGNFLYRGQEILFT